jgi:hypothetical protein
VLEVAPPILNPLTLHWYVGLVTLVAVTWKVTGVFEQTLVLPAGFVAMVAVGTSGALTVIVKMLLLAVVPV